MTGTYNGATANAAAYESGTLTGNVPANAFQQPILLGYTDDYDSGPNASTTVRLAYLFGAGVTPSLFRELDVKLDDGNPGTGVVRATVSEANVGEATVGGEDFGASSAVTWSADSGPACVTNANTATAIWNVDSDNTTCNAVFLY